MIFLRKVIDSTGTDVDPTTSLRILEENEITDVSGGGLISDTVKLAEGKETLSAWEGDIVADINHAI